MLKLRWKVGDMEFEAEGEEKFITEQFKLFIERLDRPGAKRASSDLPNQIISSAKETKDQSRKGLSPAEFIRLKAPQGGTEQLIVLGKFLEDSRGVREFTRREINALAAEAKLKDIHSQYFSNAVQQGLLRDAGDKKYAITLSGEDVVLAMPKKKA